jgi:hypothetical protein
MRELYPGISGPGTFRMGSDGVVYRVPGRGRPARGMTGGLPSPAVIPAPGDIGVPGNMQDLLKHLPQMAGVGGC